MDKLNKNKFNSRDKPIYVDCLISPSGALLLEIEEDKLMKVGIDIGQCKRITMTIDEYELLKSTGKLLNGE